MESRSARPPLEALILAPGTNMRRAHVERVNFREQKCTLSSSQDGYTFLEVLVVVAIIAAVATLGIQAINVTRASSERDRVVSDVEKALWFERLSAQERGRPSKLEIDVTKNMLASQATSKIVQLPSKVRLRFVGSENQLLSNSKAEVVFFPDGSSSGGDIYLEHEQHTALVRIEWLTGRIKSQSNVSQTGTR